VLEFGVGLKSCLGIGLWFGLGLGLKQNNMILFNIQRNRVNIKARVWARTWIKTWSGVWADAWAWVRLGAYARTK
jgi:hypothetical protein